MCPIHQVVQVAVSLKAHPTAAPPAAAHLKVPVPAVPRAAAGQIYNTFQVLHLQATPQAKHQKALPRAAYLHQCLVRAVHYLQKVSVKVASVQAPAAKA